MSNNECNTNILREVLYKYAGMGAHLFPLCWPEWNDSGHVHCGYGHRDDKGQPEQDNIGKAPLLSGGYRNATQTHAGIDDWLLKYPKANWGAYWPNQLVLDVDQDNDAYEDLARLVADIGELPQTLEQLSGGGGKHIVYLLPEGVNLKAAKLPGYERIHVKINGYIVVAGSIHKSGKPYSISHDGAIAQAPQTIISLFLTKQTGSEANRIDAIKEGSRHVDLISVIGKLRNDNIAEDLVEAMAQSANASADIPLSQSEVTKMVREYEHQAKPASYNFTDLGNAERLCRKYRDIFQWVIERKMFYVWNGSVWQTDTPDNTKLLYLAKQIVRTITDEKQPEMTDEGYKKLLNFAIASESEKRLNSMVSLARNEPGISISILEFNKDKYLFNIKNGTVNLKSGMLQPHRKEDYITQMAPVSYDNTAICPKWEAFLELIQPDPDVRIYLQKLVGYAMTGDTKTQVIPFCWGPGGNGKSTMWGTIKRLFGTDYSHEIDTEVFLVSRNNFRDSSIREQLANLYQNRLVTCLELTKSRQLQINLLKAITGGEAITGDRKYERTITFQPTFKVILSGNNEPTVRDTTDAAWRRLKKIPFSITIPSPIDGYDSNFDDEMSGILNWAIRGCLAWQQEGLIEPCEIRQATEEYRQDQDSLNKFISECCECGVRYRVLKKTFKTALEQWLIDSSCELLSDAEIKDRLKNYKIVEQKSGPDRFWKGIQIKESGQDGHSGQPNL